MLPDLESLRCFLAACSHPSFRAAAQAVALSPAAFGERIRRLEEQVGAPLFVRTTRRVALTAAGVRLAPRARKILEDARRALAEAREPGAAAPYELTLGTRFELGLSWLVPALGALAKRRPERTLHLVFGDTDELLSRTRRGNVDAAVTSARLTSSGIRYALLHEERYAFVGSARLLRSTPLTRPEHATGHALLDIQGDLPLSRYFLDAVPRGQVWGFARIGYLGTIAAIRHRVLEGAGVAVLPRYFVEEDLRRRRLVEPLPRVKLERDFFRLVWREGHPREDALQELAGELRARALA